MAPLGSGRARELLDAVVGPIRDVDIAGRVDPDPPRLVEQRYGAVDARTAEPRAARWAPRDRVAVARRHGDPPLAVGGRCELLDPVVQRIGVVVVAVGIERSVVDVVGGQISGLSRRAVQAGGADAGDGVDVPRKSPKRRHRGGGDLSDAMVPCVGDEEVARGIDRHPIGVEQRGRRSRPAVTREAGGRSWVSAEPIEVVLRHGLAELALGARGEDLDLVVARVRDDEVPTRSKGQAVRPAEQRSVGRSADPGIARRAARAACHGVDVVGRHGLAPLGPSRARDLLDLCVVGDVEVAVDIECHRRRRRQRTRGGGPTVSGRSSWRADDTGDGDNGIGRERLAPGRRALDRLLRHPGVARVSDVEIARGVDGDALRGPQELARAARAAVHAGDDVGVVGEHRCAPLALVGDRDLHHVVGGGVGDVEVAEGVQGNR